MDTDNLRAEINAVEQEIAGQFSSVTRKHRHNIPWAMIIAALLVFVVVEWSVHHRQKTGIDADLNHMMQQARHDHPWRHLVPLAPQRHASFLEPLVVEEHLVLARPK